MAPLLLWFAALWPDRFQKADELPILDQGLHALLVFGPLGVAVGLVLGTEKLAIPFLNDVR